MSVSTTLMFGPGEVRKEVTIPISDDTVPEQAEVFTATLMSTEPNVVVDAGEATVTILENDHGNTSLLSLSCVPLPGILSHCTE